MKYVIVNGLTMLNACSGFAAMILLAAGPAAGISLERAAYWAACLILLGFIFDIADGVAASALDARSELGGQLDIYADTVTFNIAAATLIVLAPIATSEPSWLFVVRCLVGAAWVCCGLYRSARLSIISAPEGEDGRYFVGMTTNGAATMAAGMVLAVDDLSAWVEPTLAFTCVFLAVALLFSALMVSRIEYPDLPKHYARGLLPRWHVPVMVVCTVFAPGITIVTVTLIMTVFLHRRQKA